MKKVLLITVFTIAGSKALHSQPFTNNLLGTTTVSRLVDIQLQATCLQGTANISWKPAKTMVSVSRYELQKSSDGITYSYVTALPATAAINHQFAYTDKYLFETWNMYRVKIVDHQGNYIYTAPAIFNRTQAAKNISILSAIAHTELLLWLPANSTAVQATIKDAAGRPVMHINQFNQTTHVTRINVATIKAGIYSLCVQTNTGQSPPLKFAKK
ncbi:MAG: hypothetical protein RL172_3349 [Bacteroidota bacterium]|jgi:hypothetical protein